MNNTRFYAEHRKEIPHLQVPLSKRFLDENGKPVLWELKPMSQYENEELLKKCRGLHKRIDSAEYEAALLAEAVVYPELKNIELQNSYGVVGSTALIQTMLTAGEFAALKDALEDICLT